MSYPTKFQDNCLYTFYFLHSFVDTNPTVRIVDNNTSVSNTSILNYIAHNAKSSNLIKYVIMTMHDYDLQQTASFVYDIKHEINVDQSYYLDYKQQYPNEIKKNIQME